MCVRESVSSVCLVWICRSAGSKKNMWKQNKMEYRERERECRRHVLQRHLYRLESYLRQRLNELNSGGPALLVNRSKLKRWCVWLVSLLTGSRPDGSVFRSRRSSTPTTLSGLWSTPKRLYRSGWIRRIVRFVSHQFIRHWRHFRRFGSRRRPKNQVAETHYAFVSWLKWMLTLDF